MRQFAVFALLAGLAGALFAGPAAAAGEADALDRFLRGLRGFSADFEQLQRDEAGRVLQATRGHLRLARPGRFHWQVNEPYAQTLVADGESLWFYDPDLEQVTRRNLAGALAGTPAALLAEGAGLDDDFHIGEGRRTPEGTVVVLRPRSAESDFVAVTLTLRDDGAPLAISFEDQLGGITLVHFGRLQVNPDFAADAFRFEPPPGVERVDLE